MLYLSLDKWFYQCIYTILKRMYIYGSTNAQLLMNKYYTIEITEQYHCVEQKTGGCVKMYTSSFLCTKPRLSQARALLFPKVFVPLGTKKISL